MFSKKLASFFWGLVMTVNFLSFWAVPIAGMGMLWKYCVKDYIVPVYDLIDKSLILRDFATKYIYAKQNGADFFATSILTIFSTLVSVSAVFYWQLTYGYLPWYVILAYYCAWVGIGGRMMGAAYALAHKEGHNSNLYQKWIRNSVGNVFENWLGLFFGNLPHNFSGSHVFIHHKLDGGIGDTFYQWDLDRSSVHDFMLYVNRIFLHMIGYSSIKFFDMHDQKKKSDMIKNGVNRYLIAAAFILISTRSLSFVFWIFLQPLFCMTYFLALINFGFHGFIEFDSEGKSIPCVNSTTIILGDDDYFGEDDHMAHHYNINVYFKDLAAHQQSQLDVFKKYKASVFQKLSILELSIFVLFGLWDKLAEHYVDYSGDMSKQEIAQMLKVRAQRKETTYDVYEAYLANPTLEARKALAAATGSKVFHIDPVVDLHPRQ